MRSPLTFAVVSLAGCSGLFGIDFDAGSTGGVGGAGASSVISTGGGGGAGAQGGGPIGGGGAGTCQPVDVGVPVSGEFQLLVEAVERVHERRFFVVGSTAGATTVATTEPDDSAALDANRPFVLDVQVGEDGTPTTIRAASFGEVGAVPTNTTLVDGALHVVGVDPAPIVLDGAYGSLGADPTASPPATGVAIRTSTSVDSNAVDTARAIADRGDGVVAVAGSCFGPTVEAPSGQLSLASLREGQPWACPVFPDGPPSATFEAAPPSPTFITDLALFAGELHYVGQELGEQAGVVKLGRFDSTWSAIPSPDLTASPALLASPSIAASGDHLYASFPTNAMGSAWEVRRLSPSSAATSLVLADPAASTSELTLDASPGGVAVASFVPIPNEFTLGGWAAPSSSFLAARFDPALTIAVGFTTTGDASIAGAVMNGPSVVVLGQAVAASDSLVATTGEPGDIPGPSTQRLFLVDRCWGLGSRARGATVFVQGFTPPPRSGSSAGMSDVLLDPKAVDAALTRLAAEIAAPRADSPDAPILVAIARGGEPFAKRLAAKMQGLGVTPALGVVDITLYRDDAATALPNPRIGPSHIPTPIEGRRVVLVDDVLHTGRTIRAALDAVLDYGRPRGIELAVLVDRGGRELPIAATYVGHVAVVAPGARVEVMMKRVGPGVDDEEPWALIVPDGRSGRGAKGAAS